MSSKMHPHDPFLLGMQKYVDSHKQVVVLKHELETVLTELGQQNVRLACDAGHRGRFETLMDEWKARDVQ